MDNCKQYYIPPELLRIIVDHLKLKDFLSFRLVCKLFYKVASRQVYHKNFLKKKAITFYSFDNAHCLPNGLLHGTCIKQYQVWYEIINYYEDKPHGLSYGYKLNHELSKYDSTTVRHNEYELAIVRTYEHGNLHGPFTEYFPDSKIEGVILDGKISGNYECKTRTTDSLHWIDKNKDYIHKYTLEDGYCLEYQRFSCLPNGTVRKIFEFTGKQAIVIGDIKRVTVRYGISHLHEEISYALREHIHKYQYTYDSEPKFKDICPQGRIQKWSEAGKLILDQYFHLVDEVLTGWRKFYHDNGKLETTQHFRHGHLVGWVDCYDNDGRLRDKKYYNNKGNLDGWHLVFNNHLLRATNYEDGNILEKRIYHSNGHLSYNLKYQDNMPIGEECNYNGNGHLTTKHYYIQYYNDKAKCLLSSKHGTSLIYNGHVNSRIIAEIPHVNGKIDGCVRVYYNNGLLRKLITHKDNRPHGYYEIFNKKGQLIECGEKGCIGIGGLGVYHSWRKIYDFQGRLISEENYDKDGTLINEIRYKYLNLPKKTV